MSGESTPIPVCAEFSDVLLGFLNRGPPEEAEVLLPQAAKHALASGRRVWWPIGDQLHLLPGPGWRWQEETDEAIASWELVAVGGEVVGWVWKKSYGRREWSAVLADRRHREAYVACPVGAFHAIESWALESGVSLL